MSRPVVGGMRELTAPGVSTELVGRRVKLRPLRRRISKHGMRCGRGVASGCCPGSRGERALSAGRPSELHDPLLHAGAGAAARDGLWFRDFRQRPLRGRGQPLLRATRAFQNAYVGYWMDQLHAGRGYVPEACVLLFRFAFEDLGLHRLQISIIPRNRPSRRVAQKLWLRGEGIAFATSNRRQVGGPRALRHHERGVGRAARPLPPPVADEPTSF